VRKPDVSIEAKLGELHKVCVHTPLPCPRVHLCAHGKAGLMMMSLQVLVQPGMRGLVDEVGLVVIPARHKHAYEQWLRQRIAKMC
jgi:hypothetical protein